MTKRPFHPVLGSLYDEEPLDEVVVASNVHGQGATDEAFVPLANSLVGKAFCDDCGQIVERAHVCPALGLFEAPKPPVKTGLRQLAASLLRRVARRLDS